MSRILIQYASVTKNTEAVALKLKEGLENNHQVTLLKIGDKANYGDYDYLLMGFWVDKATANKKALQVLKKIRDSKVGLFGTLGANPDSEHGLQCSKNVDSILDPSNTYLGSILVNGKVNEKLIKKIKFIPFLKKEIKEKMYQTSLASRAPNEEDFKKVVDFFKDKVNL